MMHTPRQIDPDNTSWDLRDALWTFETARYSVALFAEDEDIDPADSFEFPEDIAFAREDHPAHWFCAVVAVYGPDGRQIGRAVLGGCSYNSFSEFYSGHRGKDPMNRNCSLMRASRGNIVICHYLPAMVREAISDARAHLARCRDGDATSA